MDVPTHNGICACHCCHRSSNNREKERERETLVKVATICTCHLSCYCHCPSTVEGWKGDATDLRWWETCEKPIFYSLPFCLCANTWIYLFIWHTGCRLNVRPPLAAPLASTTSTTTTSFCTNTIFNFPFFSLWFFDRKHFFSLSLSAAATLSYPKIEYVYAENGLCTRISDEGI